MSVKSKVTGSSTEKRVRHLISIGAFTKDDLVDHQSGDSEDTVKLNLLKYVTAAQERFEEEQKGAIIQRAPGNLTVEALLAATTPHRGSNYPDFQHHSQLKVIGSTGQRHMIIMDCRRAIFAYRFPIPEIYIEKLERTDKILPARKAREEGKGPRGDFSIREYACWADYSTHTYMNKGYLSDMPHSYKWKTENENLFTYCSERLRLIAPDQWVAMKKLWDNTQGRVNKGQKRKKKADEGVADERVEAEKLHHVAGIWPGVAINQRQIRDGKCHRDIQDGRGKFNLVIPYGTWEGGYVALWQLKKKVHVCRGEGLLFLGNAIAHNVVDIKSGVRNSLDLFCHQSNFAARRTENVRQNKLQTWNTGATVAAGDRSKLEKQVKRRGSLGGVEEKPEETKQACASKVVKKRRKEHEDIDGDGDVSTKWLEGYESWKAAV